MGDGDLALHGKIGLLPDVPAFYDWMTGREFLRYAGELHRLGRSELTTRAAELLELVDLTKAADRRVGGYSRGMRQRLGIAQALVNRPSVLFMDEPTSALDPVGRREVLDLILRLKQSATVFMSTHILSDVERVCDMVGIIDRGKLVTVSSVDALRRQYARSAFEMEFMEDAAGFVETLRKVPWLAEPQIVLVGGQPVLRVRAVDVLRARKELPGLIGQSGLTLTRYEMTLPDLEDIFVEIVGGKGTAMNGLIPLLKKELREQLRTYRLVIVGGVFLFFGITTPLLLKYLPEIIKLAGQNVPVEIPPPTAAQSLLEYAGTIGQIGVLVAVLVAMGSVANERSRGTAVMTLSKPVTRAAFIGAKWTASSLTFLVSLAAASLVCLGYTVWLIGPANAIGFYRAEPAAGRLPALLPGADRLLLEPLPQFAGRRRHRHRPHHRAGGAVGRAGRRRLPARQAARLGQQPRQRHRAGLPVVAGGHRPGHRRLSLLRPALPEDAGPLARRH